MIASGGVSVIATESQIQSAICEYLTVQKHAVIRLNNQPIFDPRRNIFRALPKYTPKGMADLLVVVEGKSIFLEVKRPGQKPRPEQLDFGRWIMAHGGDYFTVHSIDEVQALGL